MLNIKIDRDDFFQILENKIDIAYEDACIIYDKIEYAQYDRHNHTLDNINTDDVLRNVDVIKHDTDVFTAWARDTYPALDSDFVFSYLIDKYWIGDEIITYLFDSVDNFYEMTDEQVNNIIDNSRVRYEIIRRIIDEINKDNLQNEKYETYAYYDDNTMMVFYNNFTSLAMY